MLKSAVKMKPMNGYIGLILAFGVTAARTEKVLTGGYRLEVQESTENAQYRVSGFNEISGGW